MTMEEDKDGESICRDYLRNVCHRGDRCKFRHPDGEGMTNGNTPLEFMFCHDYQNRTCERPNCRFFHCTRKEQEYYLHTGVLPQHVLETAIQKGIATEWLFHGESPVCKDFLKGDCRRGGKCKFRHLSRRELEVELFGHHVNRKRIDDVENGDVCPPEAKRQFMENMAPRPLFLPGPQQEVYIPTHVAEELRCLRGENEALHKRVEELKRQVSDLRATNEFLLDQNAQLRISKVVNSGPITAAAAAAGTPAVSVPIAQISQQLPLTVVATPGQPPPAPTAPTSAAVGTAAQAIAGMASIPVSLASVSIPHSIPAVTISMSQAMAQATPQNIAMSLTSAAGNGPPALVSYPAAALRPLLPSNMS